MKVKNLMVAATLCGGLFTFDASIVSACGTCKLSRGPSLTLPGGLTIPGQVGAYPFHSGVSFEEDSADPMSISLTNRGIDFTLTLDVKSIRGINAGPNAGGSPADETFRDLSARGNNAMLYAEDGDHIDFALLDADHVDFLSAVLNGPGLGLGDAQFNIASLLGSDYRLFKVDQVGSDAITRAALAPEPGSAAFLCLGLLALIRRRTR